MIFGLGCGLEKFTNLVSTNLIIRTGDVLPLLTKLGHLVLGLVARRESVDG